MKSVNKNNCRFKRITQVGEGAFVGSVRQLPVFIVFSTQQIDNVFPINLVKLIGKFTHHHVIYLYYYRKSPGKSFEVVPLPTTLGIGRNFSFGSATALFVTNTGRTGKERLSKGYTEQENLTTHPAFTVANSRSTQWVDLTLRL